MADKTPQCCGRPMMDVISRKTSLNAYDRTTDTPVWYCADCGRKIKREVPA